MEHVTVFRAHSWLF
uniref:Uncharacterized protein n=1 Tax=Arundo donax TaxID=35708 RepID=A0A0A9AKI7_ARUDO